MPDSDDADLLARFRRRLSRIEGEVPEAPEAFQPRMERSTRLVDGRQERARNWTVSLIALGSLVTLGIATFQLLPARDPAPSSATVAASPTRPAGSPAGPTASAIPVPSAQPSASSTSARATPSPALIGWIGPERIATEHYDFVRLVVDSDGHAHVAAVTRDGIFYLTNQGGFWASERVTSVAGDGYDAEPSIALQDDGTLAIAFARFGGVRCTFVCEPVRSQGISLVTNRSGRWSDAVRIIEGKSQQPSLQAAGGQLHLAYSLGDLNNRSIFYAPEDGGAWTIQNVGKGGAPSLQIGRDGLARISFVDPRGRLYYAAADSGDGSFLVERVPGGWNASVPLLALDGTDEPQIVLFNDTDQSDPACGALSVRSTDGTWSEAARLFPDDEFCHVIGEGIDMDSDGALHVISLYDEAGPGAWYATDDVGAFRALQVREPKLLTDDGPRGVSAIDVDALGRPHILYGVLEAGAYDEDTEGEPEDDGLWYGIGPAD